MKLSLVLGAFLKPSHYCRPAVSHLTRNVITSDSADARNFTAHTYN